MRSGYSRVLAPLFLLVGLMMLLVLTLAACGGGDKDEPPTPKWSSYMPQLIDGEVELWSGTMKTGAFIFGGAQAYGYTTGVRLVDTHTGGPHGTLDDVTFTHRTLPYTIELMTYVKGINNDDVFIVGFNERLLIWDVNMALYVNGHRLRHWSTGYLHGRIDTYSYVAGDVGFSLHEGQEVSLSLRKINPSNEVRLETLTLSTGTLSPKFRADIGAYTATVTNDVENVTVRAIAFSTDAIVVTSHDATINEIYPKEKEVEVPLEVGENLFIVTVTAEDRTTRDYTITIIRAGV